MHSFDQSHSQQDTTFGSGTRSRSQDTTTLGSTRSIGIMGFCGRGDSVHSIRTVDTLPDYGYGDDEPQHAEESSRVVDYGYGEACAPAKRDQEVQRSLRESSKSCMMIKEETPPAKENPRSTSSGKKEQSTSMSRVNFCGRVDSVNSTSTSRTVDTLPDYGYGDDEPRHVEESSRREVDYGYGEACAPAKTDEPDYGYGDDEPQHAEESSRRAEVDYGYGEADYGYGEACAPAKTNESPHCGGELSKQRVIRRGSITKYSLDDVQEVQRSLGENSTSCMVMIKKEEDEETSPAKHRSTSSGKKHQSTSMSRVSKSMKSFLFGALKSTRKRIRALGSIRFRRSTE
jgi:hypothetical protein